MIFEETNLQRKTSPLVQTCAMPLTSIASPWFFLMMNKTTRQRARGWASATTLQASWSCQSSWPLSSSPPVDSNQNPAGRHQLQQKQFKLRQVWLGLLRWYVFQMSPSGSCEGSVNLYTGVSERSVAQENISCQSCSCRQNYVRYIVWMSLRIAITCLGSK